MSDKIKYKLNSSAEMRSFPFEGTDYDTPSKINDALGGHIYAMIGTGEAAINISASDGGNHWIGSLDSIKSQDGFWLKPTGSINSWGPTGTATGELSGTLRPAEASYTFEAGKPAKLISYPQPVNKSFSDAVDGDDLYHNQQIHSIIGQGEAKTFNTSLGYWIGSLTTFTTGSGYWFITSNTNSTKPIWKPDISYGNPLHYTPCDHISPDGVHFTPCGQKARYDNNYWATMAEPPYSQSGHNFGWLQTWEQNFLYWHTHLGDGTSSLLRADGTSIPLTASWQDGHEVTGSGPYHTGESWIIGAFNSSYFSSSTTAATCCGATFSPMSPEIGHHPGLHFEDGTDYGNHIWHCPVIMNTQVCVTYYLCNDTTGTYCTEGDILNLWEPPNPTTGWETTQLCYPDPDYEEQLGYPERYSYLRFRAYDPERNLVVPLQVFEVNYSEEAPNKPIIDFDYSGGDWGDKAIQVKENLTIQSFDNYGGRKRICFKMKF
tara:strand:+ start:160 stop:1626 length:1467 start_codon:yes stop_codon:yes gene_type:complete